MTQQQIKQIEELTGYKHKNFGYFEDKEDYYKFLIINESGITHSYCYEGGLFIPKK